MKTHEKFLEFNGKNIIFLNVDGTYWIALKPICKALNIDWNRSYQNVKNDPIFGPELAIQQMQVAKNGKKQARNVTCITEEFVYGWICSLRSESKDLADYKRTCYKLIYNHFHGTITGRKDLLIERQEVDKKITDLKAELKKEDLKYKELKNLENQRKTISTKLNSIDKSITNQYEMKFKEE